MKFASPLLAFVFVVLGCVAASEPEVNKEHRELFFFDGTLFTNVFNGSIGLLIFFLQGLLIPVPPPPAVTPPVVTTTPPTTPPAAPAADGDDDDGRRADRVRMMRRRKF